MALHFTPSGGPTRLLFLCRAQVSAVPDLVVLPGGNSQKCVWVETWSRYVFFYSADYMFRDLVSMQEQFVLNC